MKTDGVSAYDLPERVRTYDADMDIMRLAFYPGWQRRVLLEAQSIRQSCRLDRENIVVTGGTMVDMSDLNHPLGAQNEAVALYL